MKRWKTLEREIAFNNPWWKIQKNKVLLPNGKIIEDYLTSDLGDYVIILPILKDRKSTILIRQYKYGANEFISEFPAGKVEQNEKILSAATRELFEETGYKSRKIKCLYSIFDNPSKSKGKVHICFAEDCYKVNKQQLERTEAEIEIDVISKGELEQKLKNKKLSSFAGLLGASLILNYLTH